MEQKLTKIPFITIDEESEQPLFSQLVDGIRDAVADGRLAPGDKLPSIRQLSTDLSLNPKTVAKAFQRLERDQVIISKRYRGTFVRDDVSINFSQQLDLQIREELSCVIARLKAKGAANSELRRSFASLLNTI